MNQPIYSTTAPELNPTNNNDLKKEIHNAAIDRAIQVARSGVIAQGYTTERNEKKILDSDLLLDCVEAIANALEKEKI